MPDTTTFCYDGGGIDEHCQSPALNGNQRIKGGDDDVDRLLSVKEAAGLLGCSEAAVRKWLYQRRLTAVRVGRLVRLRVRDLEAFVQAGR